VRIQAQLESPSGQGIVLVINQVAPRGLIAGIFCAEHDHRGVGLINASNPFEQPIEIIDHRSR